MDTVINCIDVSKYQGSVNWAKVKSAGVKYAIIRSITQGLKTDSYFETNYKGAKAAGLKIGVYLFGYATTNDYAKKEAQSLVKLLNGRKLDLPVFYDLETSGLRTASAATVQKLATAFQAVVEKAGYEFGVYCDEDFYKAKGHFKGFDPKVEFWIAKYGANDGKQHILPSIQHHLIGHQFSSKGKVSGISGNVDVSNWYGPTVKAKTAKTSTLYRVRKSWSDEKSQKGAFESLGNAKKMVDVCAPGDEYFVFDSNGVPVYPVPFSIQPTGTFTYYKKSTGKDKAGSAGKGVYTITSVSGTRGKLKSGVGWVELKDLKLGYAIEPGELIIRRAKAIGDYMVKNKYHYGKKGKETTPTTFLSSVKDKSPNSSCTRFCSWVYQAAGYIKGGKVIGHSLENKDSLVGCKIIKANKSFQSLLKSKTLNPGDMLVSNTKVGNYCSIFAGYNADKKYWYEAGGPFKGTNTSLLSPYTYKAIGPIYVGYDWKHTVQYIIRPIGAGNGGIDLTSVIK